MEMIWNWQVRNTIVFSWWKTETAFGLFLSCLLVFGLSIFHEALSLYQQRQDSEALTMETAYSGIALQGPHPSYTAPRRIQRSFMFGAQAFMGIIRMLILMTFNGYLILAIVFASIVSHYTLGAAVGCH